MSTCTHTHTQTMLKEKYHVNTAYRRTVNKNKPNLGKSHFKPAYIILAPEVLANHLQAQDDTKIIILSKA